MKILGINFKIYFRLRFGVVITVHTYLRLNFHVMWGGISNLKCTSIEFITANLSLIYFCLLEIFKTST